MGNNQEAYTPVPFINLLRDYSGSIDVDVAGKLPYKYEYKTSLILF